MKKSVCLVLLFIGVIILSDPVARASDVSEPAMGQEPSVQDQQTLQQENTQLRQERAVLVQELKSSQDESLRLLSEYRQKMNNEIATGQVVVTEHDGAVSVKVGSAILFDSGKADISPEGQKMLSNIVALLKESGDRAIKVEGHTDNVPIHGRLARKYPTNWELSAARAINVTRLLQKQGIDPKRLDAMACGEFKPVASNATTEGKAKNRRIEITLAAKD